jgi:S1-C subfamily serine protease
MTSRSIASLLLAGAAVAGSVAPAAAQQDVLRRKMVAATVRVIVDPAGTGSGVILGKGNYVATNLHVITDGSTGRISSSIRVAAMVGGQVKVVSAREIWHAEPARRDVAILELAEQFTDAAPPMSLSAMQTDQVWAVGFPGVTDLARISDAGSATDGADAAQRTVRNFFEALTHPTPELLQPTVNLGTVARVHDTIRDFGGARVVQHQAPINKGNSGGPLFDNCGALLGLNVAKTDLSRATEEIAQGTNFAIHTSEVQAGLRQLHIPFTSAPHCEPARESEGGVGWPIWMALGLSLAVAVAALAITVTPRGRSAVRQVSQRWSPSRRMPEVPGRGAAPPIAPVPPPPPLEPHAQAMYGLRCLAGEFEGLDLTIGDEPVTIGRDPTLRGLVFTSDRSSAISKRHCEVRVDRARRQIMLTDLNSSNGTFLADGSRLTAYAARALHAGDRFYLASPDIMFELTSPLGR